MVLTQCWLHNGVMSACMAVLDSCWRKMGRRCAARTRRILLLFAMWAKYPLVAPYKKGRDTCWLAGALTAPVAGSLINTWFFNLKASDVWERDLRA